MNKLLKVHHRSSASLFKSTMTTEVSSEDVVATAVATSNRVRSEGFSFRFGSEVKREVNRCFGCRRKVGLTEFWCQCGELFCAEHWYTDRHMCNYDYKATGHYDLSLSISLSLTILERERENLRRRKKEKKRERKIVVKENQNSLRFSFSRSIFNYLFFFLNFFFFGWK